MTLPIVISRMMVIIYRPHKVTSFEHTFRTGIVFKNRPERGPERAVVEKCYLLIEKKLVV
ncbi:MAG: hypothetical protein PVJ21_20895 [Anaerolineales bacterium]